MIENNQLGLDSSGSSTDAEYLAGLSDDAAREAALEAVVTQRVNGDDLEILVNGNVVAIVEGQRGVLDESAVLDNGDYVVQFTVPEPSSS